MVSITRQAVKISTISHPIEVFNIFTRATKVLSLQWAIFRFSKLIDLLLLEVNSGISSQAVQMSQASEKQAVLLCLLILCSWI